ncbi:hypothetical protein BaRGS_00018153 [Batillaria attramentaria]|uniref:Uncharacterized protein n=1 Tax=Batillaria attramentaria TaxID=370345 RepID=A0ABD0KTP5_9CAEN
MGHEGKRAANSWTRTVSHNEGGDETGFVVVGGERGGGVGRGRRVGEEGETGVQRQTSPVSINHSQIAPSGTTWEENRTPSRLETERQ